MLIRTNSLQVIYRNLSLSSARTKGKRVHVNHELHGIIKWVKPDQLVSWDPQRTCDLEPLKPVDPNWLKLEYRPFASIIDKLPEEHRKLFTVELGARKDGLAVIMEDTVDEVRRHKYDKESSEYKIARMTVKIRNIQDILENNIEKSKRSPHFRTSVKELVEKRKKYLSRLKNQDYKRFEWVLEILNVIYKPIPSTADRVERKKSYRMLTEMYCEAMKRKKLNAYKDELDTQKIPFLEEKLATLQRIKADEDSMRIPCSVEDDIAKTIKQLENVKMSHLVLEPAPENQQSIEPK